MEREPMYSAEQTGAEEPSSDRSWRRMIIAASILALILVMALAFRVSVGATDARRPAGAAGRSSTYPRHDRRGDMVTELATAAKRAQAASTRRSGAREHHGSEHEHESEEEHEFEGGDD